MAVDGPARPTDGPTGPSRRTVLLAVVAASPAIVAAALAATRGWRPVGDQALEVLRTADVGGRHTPLVGAWSRWGWSHPGPWLFWVLAPFRWIGGARGVLVATGLLNAAAAAGTVVVTARRGGPARTAAVAVASCWLLFAVGLHGSVDPWNPYVATVPFLLVLVAAAAAVDGDPAGAVVALVAGSWCVQAHAMFLLPVAVAVALAVGTALRTLHGVGPRERRGVLLAAGIGAGLMWLPPLVDQVVGAGNLGRLVRDALTADRPTVGWSRALAVADAQLAPTGPLVGGAASDGLGLARTTSGPWVAVLGAALVVVLVVRRRAGGRNGLAVVGLAALVAGLVATSRISGLLAPYLLRLWWPTAVLGVLAVAVEVGPRLPRPVRERAPAALTAAAVLLAAGTVATGVPLRGPVEEVGRALSPLVGPTVRALDPGRPVMVEESDLRYWGFVTPGMVLALEETGADARVRTSPLAALQFGAHRTVAPDDRTQTVAVVGLDQLATGTRPAGREVARTDPLGPGERAESDALHRQAVALLDLPQDRPRPPLATPSVRRRLRAAGMSTDRLDRLLELEARGPSYAVFVDPGRPSP